MTNKKYNYLIPVFASLFLFLFIGCERDVDELEVATFPTTGDVFIDGFTGGLSYAAFGGSKVTAFDVDQDIKFLGSASMRFDVPDAGDPAGGYAGGVYLDQGGRDLSGYDALTFWARASKAATIDLVGFGNDFGDSKYQVSLNNIKVNSSWKKYIIPIPDPSKLTEERGMFQYAEAPEEGLGYSFWIDELKFEKLGTIAHPNPAILETQDQIIPASTGDRLPIGGIFADFNLPSGIDQRVDFAPAYLTFASSNPSLATVSDIGVVTVLDSGTVVVTAKLLDIDARGSLTIGASGDAVAPQTPAPVPTTNADSVISLFSNAYDDVPIDTWNTRWQFSTAEDVDIQVAGDDIKKYTMLNFVGIEFASQTIDATAMTHFHLDLWTPDATDLPASFKILLIDFGADGSFDGGDDVQHEVSITNPKLMTENWVSLDIPLSNFAGLTTRAHLAQMVLSGDLPNVFIDNVYFANRGVVTSTGPNDAAPTPTRNAADVISVFSDAYTNIAGVDLNPDWGQATVVSQVGVNGNNTLLYAGLNYQGLDLGGSQDISSMTHLHLDYWTDNSSAFSTFLISDGPVEDAEVLNVPTSGWASMDISLANFSPVDIANLIQLKFEGTGDIYLDNIYFYKGGGNPTEPNEAAPTPTRNAANVISVFSDAYTNVSANLNPDWGQATMTSELSVAGNNTLRMLGLNYQGIELGGGQNVSTMSHLHLDVWTANSTALSTFLISTGPIETAKILSVPTSGWASIDIPLGDFTPVDLADVIQFKFEGDGDIYFDNIYFYLEGSTPTEPTVAAPIPTRNAADVVSIFSDAYTNVAGANLNPDWGQATMTSEVPIAGNNTLRMLGLNYQGIELASGQDISTMTHLYMDVWTVNSTALSTFLISSGPVETAKVLSVPTTGWASVEIPLADFSPVDLADLIQLKFEGDGDIYFDNIYFYKDGGTGGDKPTEAAPTPTLDAADVLSVFSDAYTNVAGTDLNPNWGQATVVTQEAVAGNNTLVYTGLNYQGIMLGSSQNVTGMTHLHVDIWTANSTALNAFLISTGPVETAKALAVPTSGWLSVEIPLSEFSPVNLADIIQFKFDGDGDIYLDNIYFHK